MMLNLPVNLPDTDSARPSGTSSPGASSSAGAAEQDGHPFALLMAADDLVVIPATAGGDTALETPLDTAGTTAADPLAEALAEELEAALFAPGTGNALPPAGALLPSGTPGQPPAAPVTAVPPGGTDSLQRMLGVMRGLYGLGGPAGAGGAALQFEGTADLPGKPGAGLDPGLLLKMTAPAEPAQPAAASAAAQPLGVQAGAGAALPTAPPALPIAVTPGQPQWGEAVGQRVLWMIANGSQLAELRLNPPELGPVEVKVRAGDDGLKLSFAAGNAGVREALEAAAPRLREMLLAEGLQLDQMDIGQRHAGAGEHGAPETDGMQAAAGEGDGDDAAADPRATPPGRVGLVDCFV